MDATAKEQKNIMSKPRSSLNVSEDKMRLLLSCGAELRPDEELFEEIQASMQNAGIKSPLDKKSLIEAMAKANEENQGLSNFTVAAGTPPEPGKDGRLEWSGDYFSTGYYVDPTTKRIDFRQRIGIPAVEKDELIVKIFPPVPGKPGCDLYGKTLKPEIGKAVKLRPGPNVVWDEDQKGFKAKCSGRVKLNGEVLDVENIYRINGNVGKETGNITHSGQLLVNGDVDSNYKLEVGEDIEVRGIIYASDITCGGKLTAKEGINGDPSKKIIVKNEMFAKYINNAYVESEAMIVVKNEIFQSTVKTRGELNCSSGRIVGGETFAVRGITVGEAGGRSDVSTVLVAGVDYYLLDRMKKNNNAVNKLREMLKKLLIAERQLGQNKFHKNPKQQETLLEINFKKEEVIEEIKKTENLNKEIVREINDCNNARITILDMVHPGVILRISDAQHKIKDVLAGPVTAYYDRTSGKIALTSENVN